MDDIATKPPDVEPADAGATPGFSTSTHPAKRLRSLGYSVVSVVPPEAPLSPSTDIDPETRGKVPGVKGPDGWKGYRWRNGRPSRQAVAHIVEDGASVGVRAKTTPGLDIDVDDAALASVIEKGALEFLGDAPIRLSREPRRLLVYRTDEPFSKIVCELEVEPTPEAGFEGGTHKVELLGAGQQYLVHGPHPSGSEYSWQGSPLWEYAPEDLTPITAEQVADFFDHLRARFEGSAVSVEVSGSGSSRPAPSQEELEAPSLERLDDVVTKIPNEGPAFESREAYLDVGYAIKAAAGPGNEGKALELFQRWASRWKDGDNPPERVRRDFEGMHPPYRLGWRKLLELAGEIHQLAADVFQANPDAEPNPSEEHTGFLSRIKTAAELIAEPRPPIEYVVGGKLARGRNSIVAAPPKCGKSTLMRSLVTAVAKGQDWLGMPTSQGRILYVALEEHKDDVAADLETFGADVDNLDTYVGPSPEDLPGAIRAAARKRGDYSLVIIDTIFRGVKTEDGNAYMETTASLDDVIHLAHDSDAHVLCVHHTRKGVAYTGGDPFEGILGSTGIWASFDAGMMYLPAAKLGDDYRRLITRGRRHVESDSRVVYQTPDGLLECAGTWTDVQAEQLYDHLRGHGPSTRDEMAAGLGWGKTTIRKYVAFLEDAGKVEQTGEGVKGDPYKWAVTDSTQSYDPDVTTVFSADTEAADLSDLEGES